MFRYKNITLTLFYQILIGLFTAILIFNFGKKGFLFLIFIALRPLIFEKQKIDQNDPHFYFFYKILLYSVIVTSLTIILFYIVNLLFINEGFLIVNRFNFILMIIPIFILLHGIIGLLYLRYNNNN